MSEGRKTKSITKRRERPLSPHLTIYKPQITSVLSITHRATGVFLLAGMLLITWWLLAIAYGPEAYDCVSNFLNAWYGQLLLLGFTFALYYHLLNGIRHLFWDAGMGLTISDVTLSGILIVMGTLALTGFTWYAAYNF